MKPQLDAYSSLDTPIHRWETRTKIVALIILVFSFSFIKSLYLIPAMFVISAVLFFFSRLPFKYLLMRWCIPLFFFIVLGGFIIFFSEGTAVFKLGPLAAKKEGIITFVVIISRFLSILTVMVVLFGSTNFLQFIKALRSLGLPQVLTDMTMFSYRYLFQLGSDLKTMQTAMKLRGFKNKKIKDIIYLVPLAGTIFIRSYEQSDMVYNAMILRGYGQEKAVDYEFKTKKKDFLLLALFIVISIGIVAAQIVIS